MSLAMPVPSPCNSQIHKPPPLLVVPLQHSYNRPCFLYNPVDSKMTSTNMHCDNDQNCRCVGSWKGWLILHQWINDVESSLYLFNPLCKSVRNIVLPCYNRPDDFKISLVRKSVLALNPVQSDFKFVVVFLYGLCYNKIAVLMMHDVREDKNKWIDLECSHGDYADVVSNQEFLFALLTCGSVDVWDLRSGSSDGGSVDKKMRIRTSGLGFDYVGEYGDRFRDLYTTKIYLVESQGNLFVVLRVIGEFVKEDGEVVDEGALLDDEVYSHLVLPYRTKNFYVYKLDSNLENWVKVESLGDQIFFVGLNQSMFFSTSDIQECQGNSIYFTDDYWDHIEIHEHDMYGGHDSGIYNLSDKRVEEMFEMMRMVPPAVWVDQDISGL